MEKIAHKPVLPGVEVDSEMPEKPTTTTTTPVMSSRKFLAEDVDDVIVINDVSSNDDLEGPPGNIFYPHEVFGVLPVHQWREC
jgi:hypothetical protein